MTDQQAQCPHGHIYGTCLMCYHDLVAEQQSEIERLRGKWQQLNDAYMALKGDEAKRLAKPTQRQDRCPDGEHDWGEYFCRRCGSSVVQLG